MRHKTSLGLFNYWKRCCGTDAAPHRRDISPADIQQYLPAVFILDRSDTGHFIFRLAGTGTCTLFGYELRHTILTELWHGEKAKTTRDVVEAVVAKSRPAVIEGHAMSCSGCTLPVEILLLPLQVEPDGPECILGAINVLEYPLWLDTDPVHHFVDTTARFLDPSVMNEDEDNRAAETTQPPAAIFRSRGSATNPARLQRLTLIETAKSD